MKITRILFSLAILSTLLSFTISDESASYKVDPAKSEVKWTGYHLAKSYEHYGFIKIKSGGLEITNGEISGGAFVIDMNSISNADLTKEKDNAKLVRHLKSEDFFYAEKYPEASLDITSVSKEGDKYKANADLTIRGITDKISFDISVSNKSENSIEATADIKIDRSIYKVLYGWSIENAVISNEFDLNVKLVATK